MSKLKPFSLQVKYLGLVGYEPTWKAMLDYTNQRDQDSPDQLWLVEHQPVFTQGQAGKEEHVLAPGDIPVVQVDRGGQVTYHGPGQLVAYPLINLKRLGIGVRDLVTAIESSIVAALAEYSLTAYPKADAPGVYIKADHQGRSQVEHKIASLGLRVRRGCSFHGLALNVAMDLSPFLRINPCGYAGLPMAQLQDLLATPVDMKQVQTRLATCLARQLGYESIDIISDH